MSNAALELRQISKSFVQGGSHLDVLRDCSITIQPGELTALVGPSGCGKSTLLHIAGLLEQPGSGEVWVGGVNAARANQFANRRFAFRRGLVALWDLCLEQRPTPPCTDWCAGPPRASSDSRHRGE